MKIRIISMILCIATLLSIVTGCSGETADGGKTVINEELTFSPLTADGDEQLFDNPDRGYRTEFCILVEKKKESGKEYDPRTVFVDQSDEQIRSKIQSIFDIYIYNKAEQAKLSLSYIYITPWRDEELTPQLLNFFEIYFTMCREQKIKNMLRVSYCTASNRLAEGADQQTIIRHVKQLKDVIAEYADTIHTISCGFVGAYGEWAPVYQRPEVDYATVIKAIVENLAVPNDLYFSIRSPKYKNLVGEDYEYYWSISHNNDAMFGQQTHGWHSDDYEVGTPEWTQVTNEAAYTPQGGEMFVNSVMFNDQKIPSGMEIALECYFHRHTSMSFWHGYLEAYKGDNVMKRWQETEFIKPEMLVSEGIKVYDPNWFVDDSGNAVVRNPYEFIRDHLGYRLVAQNAKVNWSGEATDKISVEMSFNNYGFAAAFNMHSGFAILDSNYNVVSEVAAGEPKTWYSRDPENTYADEALTHTVSAELNGVSEKGTYYVAFYLRNTMGTYAALSNKMERANGYNILYSFEVK